MVGMKEAVDRTIVLKGKCKSEFEAVMTFLRPGSSRAQKIDAGNVDFLIKWFDEYEMCTLKEECEDFLMTMPCTLERLLQAKQLSLVRQYARCLEFVSNNFDEMPVEQIAEDHKIAADILPVLKRARLNEKNAHEQALQSFCEALHEQVYHLPFALRQKLDGSGAMTLNGRREYISILVQEELSKLIAEIKT